MLQRVLEPEVMDTPADAADYDSMDHSAVNRAFAVDFISNAQNIVGPILDVGTGTALIPIELCRQSPTISIVAIDLADEMLKLAVFNVQQAGLTQRVRIEKANGRGLIYSKGEFPAVISNSIIHHIPDPFECFSEMVRVCSPGGVIFVRDLIRPPDEAALLHLVNLYAGNANAHQQTLFADSLRAALTLAEVQSQVVQLGYDASTVTQTSDRHWTWSAMN